MAAYNSELHYLFELRFPIKLWAIIHSKNEAITWCKVEESLIALYSPSLTIGSSISLLSSSIVLINKELLTNYLQSSVSIFAAKEFKTFVIELESYNFKKIMTELNSENFFAFYHENFLRGKVELLSQITNPLQVNRQQLQQSTSPSKINKIEKAQIRLKTIVQTNYMVQHLKNELNKYHKKNIEFIEISNDLYINPKETVSTFEEKSEYAGFYGFHCGINAEKIKEFYDEFLPKYAETNVKDIVEKGYNEDCSMEQPKIKIEETPENTIIFENHLENLGNTNDIRNLGGTYVDQPCDFFFGANDGQFYVLENYKDSDLIACFEMPGSDRIIFSNTFILLHSQ